MVRLESLTLVNVKNTEEGSIVFRDLPSGGSITGIYGQNGSGKMSVITALQCLRYLMSGWPLPSECGTGLVGQGSESASITAVFSTDLGEVTYGLHAQPTDDGKTQVSREVIELRAAKDGGNGQGRRQTLLDHAVSEGELGLLDSTMSPANKWGSLKSVRKADARFRQEETLAWSQCRSFVFSNSFMGILAAIDAEISKNDALPKMKMAARDMNRQLIAVLKALSEHARLNMRVMSTREGASVAFGYVPIEHGSNFDVLDIGRPVVVPEDLRSTIEQMVEQSNMVLPTVVPNLQLECDMQEAVTEDKQPGVRVFLKSVRKIEGREVHIPFWAESEGIKRIVGMLSLLTRMFNEPDACIAIDEIDAGVFEILLGNILRVLAERGRGQLIFTAHNLRVLEVLPSKAIVFSTSNPKNRFLSIKGVRDTSNLRDMYIRSVNINDQPEELAPRISTSRVAVAFNKAGRVASSHPGISLPKHQRR